MVNNPDCNTICEMIENMLTGVAFFNFQEDQIELLYMNRGGFRMLGYTQEMGLKYLNNLMSLILEEDKPKFWQALEDVMKDDGAVDLEMRTVTATGGLRWLHIRGNLYEKTQEGATILCAFMDVTDEKFVENEMLLQTQWYQMLLEASGETLLDYNAKTDVLAIKSASKYGMESSEIIDQYLAKTRARAEAEVASEEGKIVELMEGALKIPRTDMIELKLKLRKGQEKRWYALHISSIAGVDGYVTHIVGKLTDIHEKKMLLEELREKDKLDPLTGWYGPEEIQKQVGQALVDSRETDIHAFILVDMSNFRIISEGLGEDTGNGILRDVAKKIERDLKRLDILGRISGQEFVIFVQNIGAVANLDTIAARIAHDTEVTLGTGDDSITIAGYVGVSAYPHQGDTWSELYLRSERAVNSLKASGRPGHHIYDLSGMLQKEMVEGEKTKIFYDDLNTCDSLEDCLEQILCAPKQNDNLTRAILKMIVRYYGFHKAFLSLDHIKDREALEFSYFDRGYEPKESNAEENTVNWFTFLKRQGMLDGLKIIHSYDDIPEELSSYMIRTKIHTMLIQPVMMSGKTAGVFVMGECTGMEWKLKASEEKRMKRVLQMVQTYVLRYERAEQGHATLQEVRMLENFDNYVLAVDYDTYELAFANRKLMEALPDLQLGDYCYHTFAHQDTPCDVCLMRRLDRNDPKDKKSDEWFSTSLRSWLKVHASWMQNESGSATCVLNCMDISDYFMSGNGINFTGFD